MESWQPSKVQILLEWWRFVDGARIRIWKNGIGTTGIVKFTASQLPHNLGSLSHWIPFFQSPLSLIGLNLNTQPWFFTLIFEVIGKPLEQVLHPIHSDHLRICLNASSNTTSLIHDIRPVRIVVVPLSKQPLRFDTMVVKEINRRDCHVWINVPIMHSLNEIHAAIVIVQHPFQEVSLSPISSCGFTTPHVCSKPRARANDVVWTCILQVFSIPIYTVTPIDTVVHNGCTRFTTAIPPHEFHDPDKPRNWNNCREVLISKHCSLPRCTSVV
ncbi:MAG: Uncharacterised protein [Marine Group II euryarchaeote MED-G33]|nr:MAG: Uncharacterised protein [Marine Group II euryarchaeote MED-G33]